MLGALHKQRVSDTPSILHLPYLPVLSCQSAVTRPHISKRAHITRLSAKQLMRLAPDCQSSLFLSAAREIFWLRETKKPGQQWLVVRQALLYVDIRSSTSPDHASPPRRWCWGQGWIDGRLRICFISNSSSSSRAWWIHTHTNKHRNVKQW